MTSPMIPNETPQHDPRYEIHASGSLTDIGAELTRQLSLDDLNELGRLLQETAISFGAKS